MRTARSPNSCSLRPAKIEPFLNTEAAEVLAEGIGKYCTGGRERRHSDVEFALSCGEGRKLTVISGMQSSGIIGGMMPAVISLRDIIEALDLQSDELSSYLDPDSGEIITFNAEEADIAERGDWDHAPGWMREYLPKIKRALEDDRVLPLPDRAHIDEWRMMQDFAEERDNCT